MEAHLRGYRDPESAIAPDLCSPIGSVALTFRVSAIWTSPERTVGVVEAFD